MHDTGESVAEQVGSTDYPLELIGCQLLSMIGQLNYNCHIWCFFHQLTNTNTNTSTKVQPTHSRGFLNSRSLLHVLDEAFNFANCKFCCQHIIYKRAACHKSFLSQQQFSIFLCVFFKSHPRPIKCKPDLCI